MKSVVIFATRHGNTKMIAEAIAAELGSAGTVQLLSVDDAKAILPDGTDLVVMGSPTEAHGMTEPMARFFAQLDQNALQGVAAATFDTRLRGPRWLWGSAAKVIAERLQALGAKPIAPPEGFYVTGPFGLEGGVADLMPGELERASTWARTVADGVQSKVAVGT